MLAHHGSDTRDARGDQDGVGHCADHDDQPDVVAQQTLAQHERVLGADRHDEAETGEQAGQQSSHEPRR